MGLVGVVAGPLQRLTESFAVWQVVILGVTAFLTLAVLLNILNQVLFRNPNEPPVVFHIFPLIGSTIQYGIDPYKFFFACREKYGDVYTFILLGRKVTVCLGTQGNEFILNGKLKDVNAEEVYTGLTTPVFGTGVVYDCPNSKLMEQKKFVKFGLTTDAFRQYVSLIQVETEKFVRAKFVGSGTIDIAPAMAELTIYTASRSLQGQEVRNKFDHTFADLYHDLDMGFSPINFMLPWAPLPHNRRRDYAQQKMTQTYMDIIKERRARGDNNSKDGEHDMIRNLMSCVYKNGTPVPDKEVAHMMIALLMAGQHSSSSTSSWILLRLATRPDIQEELLKEQRQVLGEDLPPLTYEDLSKLPLHAKVVKETLRIHAPIHSVMRKVKSPMSITTRSTGDNSKTYSIPTTHTLMAAMGASSRDAAHFPEPMTWEPHRWDEGHRLAYTGSTAEEEFEDYGYGMVSKGASSPYLPFGAGRHRCIGEQFAYVQLQTVVAAFVRMVKLRNPEGRKGVVDTDYSSLFSRPLAPAVVRFERRDQYGGMDEKA